MASVARLRLAQTRGVSTFTHQVRQFGNDDVYDFTAMVDAISAVDDKFGDRLRDRAPREKGTGGAILSSLDSKKAKMATMLLGGSLTPKPSASLSAWRRNRTKVASTPSRARNAPAPGPKCGD